MLFNTGGLYSHANIAVVAFEDKMIIHIDVITCMQTGYIFYT